MSSTRVDRRLAPPPQQIATGRGAAADAAAPALLARRAEKAEQSGDLAGALDLYRQASSTAGGRVAAYRAKIEALEPRVAAAGASAARAADRDRDQYVGTDVQSSLDWVRAIARPRRGQTDVDFDRVIADSQEKVRQAAAAAPGSYAVQLEAGEFFLDRAFEPAEAVPYFRKALALARQQRDPVAQAEATTWLYLASDQVAAREQRLTQRQKGQALFEQARRGWHSQPPMASQEVARMLNEAREAGSDEPELYRDIADLFADLAERHPAFWSDADKSYGEAANKAGAADPSLRGFAEAVRKRQAAAQLRVAQHQAKTGS